MVKLKMYYEYKYLFTFNEPVDVLLIVRNTNFPYTKIKLSVSDFLCVSDFLSDNNSVVRYSSINSILKEIDERGEGLMYDILKYNIEKSLSNDKKDLELLKMESRVFDQVDKYRMTKEDWKKFKRNLK